MNIDTIWNDFCSHMAEIELYGRSAKEVAKKAIEELQEYENNDVPKLKKIIKNNNLKSSIKEFTTSSHRMFFPEARTGKKVSYEMKKLNIDDRYIHIQLQQNKQYQWLLAEAYEEFEDYLEKIYAYYGSIDNSFWPLKDYGNISLSELSSKDYDWHLNQVKRKKDKPRSILNKFRSEFDLFRYTESNNKLGINLQLAIILIEKLRHIIVHKGGQISSIEKFVELVAKESNQYRNTVPDKTRDFICFFIGIKNNPNLISLLDVQLEPEILGGAELSLLSKLIGYLMSCANILNQSIIDAEKKLNSSSKCNTQS